MNNELQQNLDAILIDKNTNLKPENLKSGVTCLGVTGTYEGITPDITILSDDYGLETATSGELDNDVGIKLFTNANTQSKLYENNSIIEMHATNELIADTINLTADKLKSGESILGIEGSVIELKGQEKTITSTTKEQIITPDTNYNGITKLTINPVTSSIDSNIVAENIKNEVTILGVTGTYTGGVKTDNEFNRLFHSSGYLINIADVDGVYSRGIIKQINTVRNSNAYVTLITLPNTEAIPDESLTDGSKIIVSFDIRRMEMNSDNSLNILLNFSTTNPTHSSSAKSGYNNSYYFYINLYDTENNLIYRFNSGINTVYKGINSTAYLCSNLGNCAYQVPYCIYNVENSDPEILDKIFYNCNKATVEAISKE